MSNLNLTVLALILLATSAMVESTNVMVNHREAVSAPTHSEVHNTQDKQSFLGIVAGSENVEHSRQDVAERLRMKKDMVLSKQRTNFGLVIVGIVVICLVGVDVASKYGVVSSKGLYTRVEAKKMNIDILKEEWKEERREKRRSDFSYQANRLCDIESF